MSSEVQRGDIVVFEYPEDTGLSYAKRVVGLPGDRISYYNKRLKINDEEIQIRRIVITFTMIARFAPTNIWNDSAITSTQSFIEPEAPAIVPPVRAFPLSEHCAHTAEGLSCPGT